ncbi:MAG: hypothetical protein IJL96_09010 [Clostridia bacterium]|nr:hypothetical protein [Clostridia bacterium]
MTSRRRLNRLSSPTFWMISGIFRTSPAPGF